MWHFVVVSVLGWLATVKDTGLIHIQALTYIDRVPYFSYLAKTPFSPLPQISILDGRKKRHSTRTAHINNIISIVDYK